MNPTDFIGSKVIYRKSGQSIYSVNDKDEVHLVADVRGWGYILNLFRDKNGVIDFDKASEFQDEVGVWLAEAINEKLKETRK
jgi:hypothetical protein